MILEYALIILGLALFEIISSIDNAVLNARVIRTMSPRATRWFLTWGLFFSVFAVRGLLPLFIVYAANPALGFIGASMAAFSSDPSVTKAVETSKPVLLAGGGLYLLMLFLHWLIAENTHMAFRVEALCRKIPSQLIYVLALLLLIGVALATIGTNSLIIASAVIGVGAFFITNFLKATAEKSEAKMESRPTSRSDIMKVLYLEMLDATFSIDGVLGAFAFTTAVPLIIAGNGLGAVVVRQITIRGVTAVQELPFLTNGAMYSVAALGIIMVIEALGVELPFWISPLITTGIVAYFVYRSWVAAHPQNGWSTWYSSFNNRQKRGTRG